MDVNQRGDPISETQIFPSYGTEVDTEDLHEALNMLCEHLGVAIVRTNATKHGHSQLQLRKKEY